MTPGAAREVSVLLLNYRGGRFLTRCLAALDRLDPAPLEIIAVDNASPDGSAEILAARAAEDRDPVWRFVPAGANRGYAGGHNLGARHARGRYLAFLNVTVEPEPAWLAAADWLDAHPDVACVQPAVFHTEDPTRVESLGALFSRSGNFRVVGRNYRESRPSHGPEYASEVTSVLGAAFLARRDVFEALGGFDESMFMYFEETDLCWRAWLAGARVACWFDPQRPTRAFHTVHGTHPPGFDVPRFFERNRTLSMFRNLEARSLPWMLPQIGRVVSEQARTPRRLLRYAFEVGRALPESGARRRRLQATRTVPDDRLFGLTGPRDLSPWFAPPAPVSHEGNPK